MIRFHFIFTMFLFALLSTQAQETEQEALQTRLKKLEETLSQQSVRVSALENEIAQHKEISKILQSLLFGTNASIEYAENMVNVTTAKYQSGEASLFEKLLVQTFFEQLKMQQKKEKSKAFQHCYHKLLEQTQLHFQLDQIQTETLLKFYGFEPIKTKEESVAIKEDWLEGTPKQRQRLKGLEKLKAAPELKLSNWINSKPLSLKELKGKVVLIDFWATW